MDLPLAVRRLNRDRSGMPARIIALVAFIVFVTTAGKLALAGLPGESSVLATLDPVSADEQVVFWHVPHPDDETLGMAGGILNAAQEGKRNVVIMYTEGDGSDVRLVLNGLLYCPLHGRFHSPRQEGYEPLDKAAFGRARMAETTAALVALGVDEQDIVSIGMPDGQVTVDKAYAVMAELDRAFPGASHRTTSLSDPHDDHRNLARALNRLVQRQRAEGTPSDVRFHSVYAYKSEARRNAAPFTPVAVSDPEGKRAALAEFARWAPEEGRFAIGMHSVPGLITGAAEDPFEYVQTPSNSFRARELSAPRHAVYVFPDEIGGQWQLTRSLFVDAGWHYNSGQLVGPTITYEGATFISAAKWRLGVSPSFRPSMTVDVTRAGLRLFNHFLIEYRPRPRMDGGPGNTLQFGIQFVP